MGHFTFLCPYKFTQKLKEFKYHCKRKIYYLKKDMMPHFSLPLFIHSGYEDTHTVHVSDYVYMFYVCIKCACFVLYIQLLSNLI